MWAEFRHMLRRLRGQTIGWSIGLALYSIMMIALYRDVAQMENLQGFLDSYPEEMLAFFENMTAMNTPEGYMDTYFFSFMSMILAVFTIPACVSLLVSDEEKGLLDLVLSYPISRTGLVVSRLIALIVSLLIVLLVSWLSWVLPSNATGMNVSAVSLLLPFISLLAILMFFSTLAMLLSMLMPSGRLASLISGGLLVANFLILGLSNINQELEPITRYTPLHYYQGGLAINGLDWQAAAALIGVAALFVACTMWLFQRRDIRVGGEKGWGIRDFRKARAQS